MADEKKYSAQEAAVAVLAKAQELLGKSEFAKSVTRDEHEKGVHNVMPVYEKNKGISHGQSSAGIAVRQGNKAGESESKLSGKIKQNFIDTSKARHQNKLSELKAMPKPSLTKDEPKDENEIGTKVEKAGDPLSTIAGDRIKRGAGYKERGDKLGHKIAVEGAKESHQERLAGIKAQPKPNLSKDEPVGEIHPDEHVEGESEKPGDRIEDQKSPEDNPKEQKEGNNNEWGTQPATYGTLKLAHFMGHMSSKRKQKDKIVAPDAKSVMDPKNK